MEEYLQVDERDIEDEVEGGILKMDIVTLQSHFANAIKDFYSQWIAVSLMQKHLFLKL